MFASVVRRTDLFTHSQRPQIVRHAFDGALTLCHRYRVKSLVTTIFERRLAQ